MSSTIVSTCRIDKINQHPSADRLELAIVGGWQCCVQKGKYKAGDLITYIPPDSVLPENLSEQIGVTKYLSKGRVRAAKLRGEYSFGIIIDPVGNEGDNVAEKLGITKYQPPLKFIPGEAESPNPAFIHYTDIENLRNYPNIFQENEEVIAVEKIHGTNCRIGKIRSSIEWEKVAGSRTVQRKFVEGSIYWYPWTLDSINRLCDHLQTIANNIFCVYGEVFGNLQSLKYGNNNGISFRLFDISIDGRFLDYSDLEKLCIEFSVDMAPVIYRGPYSIDKIREISSGKSLIPGANHIREGVVVRPTKERLNEKIGRTILKYVSDEYLVGDYDGSGE